MMETAVKSASTAPARIDFEGYMESDGDSIIRSIITRYGNGIDWEEAYQELSIALWKALRAYDPSRSVKVSTFIYKSVLNRLRMMQRKAHTQKSCIEKYARVDDERCGQIKDEAVNFEEEAEQLSVLESRANALHWAIRNSNLKDCERLVILETLNGTHQKVIGAMIGKGQSQVSRMKLSAMKKIRNTLLAAHWDGEGICVRDSQSGGS